MLAPIRINDRTALYDSLVLVAIIAASCLPYMGGLGMYGDDWAFLAALVQTDGSLLESYRALMRLEMAARPVQGLLLASLYQAFGPDVTGYHVVNGAILGATVLVFYHALRLLGVDRLLAAAVPLIFGLLPHYSTDRVWIAAFQANTSMMLYFVSLAADTRFARSPWGNGWFWKAGGTLALVGSVLAYEVTAVLLLFNIAVLLYLAGDHRDRRFARPAWPVTLAMLSNVLVMAAAIAYKLAMTGRAGVSGGLRYRVLRLFTEAAPVHFGELGVGLPLRAAQTLIKYPNFAVLSTSVLIGVGVAAWLLLAVLRGHERFPVGRRWLLITVAGFLIFCGGYGMTVMTWEIGFHATGANNRTAIGAAVGTATAFVGAIGWLASALRTHRSRRVAFSTVVALLAAGSTLLTGTVARFWVDAARRQTALISSIREALPELPEGSRVLLDGLCPFYGPAPVFVTGWDTSGMLQLVYEEPSLRGDVIKRNTELLPDGIRTLLFDDVIYHHPYADNLFVFHVGRRDVHVIASHEAATDYFARISEPPGAACPPYTDGDGESIV